MQIKMNNVCKKVKGADLLSDISLTMESGNIYGFVGDNGAGKTVLFKILLGLMKKTSGSITINGAELNDLLQDVGFVIERPEYIPYYNAFKNLAVIAAYHKKADHARIREVLTMFGLDPEDKKTVGKYSLGMKQKLALAMAFLEDPAVLILDEPLSALDESSVSHAREKILEAKAQGKLIVVASHYKEDIQSLCDVVYKMKAGRIVAECREEPMNAVNI
ncbi:MAG: ABC transporter ATP-binding protein [Lachnospiraceae bacterium]|jgi:ABC-2 type transport system ATP-binding protein|nr:ABC transporter ATP-binding protein [Lachnospiraceae bacterium]